MSDLNSIVERILDDATLEADDWDQLSALVDERLATFVTLWRGLTATDRLELLDALHSESEQDPHLDYTPIWGMALRDESARVRSAGITYSADEDGEWLIDPLLRLAVGDTEASVRASAAEALGRFAYLAEVGDLPAPRARQIEDALLAIFARADEPMAVRAEALAAVGYFSTDRVREAILAAREEPALLVSAVRAMGRNCDPAWTPTLLDDTTSRAAAVREEAARAIGEIEDERGVSRLIELLEDVAVSVRIAAIGALGTIGGDDAQEALMFCLDDERDAVREAAEGALTELAERDSPLGL